MRSVAGARSFASHPFEEPGLHERGVHADTGPRFDAERLSQRNGILLRAAERTRRS